MLIDKIAATLGSAGALCLLTEALVQVIKLAVTELPNDKKQILSLLVAAILAIALVHPETGNVYTDIVIKLVVGVLSSRGSQYVHDLADTLRGYAAVARLKGVVASEVKAEK